MEKEKPEPGQEDHEAAARLMDEMGFRVVEVHQKLPALDIPVCEHTRFQIESLIAAALSEAVRVAVEKEREACWQIAIEASTKWRETFGARLGAVVIAESIRARSDAPATPAPEPVCKRCGNMHTCGCGRGTPPETGEK